MNENQLATEIHVYSLIVVEPNLPDKITIPMSEWEAEE